MKKKDRTIAVVVEVVVVVVKEFVTVSSINIIFTYISNAKITHIFSLWCFHDSDSDSIWNALAVH